MLGYLREPLASRSWPVWLRYLCTLLIVAGTVGLKLWLWPYIRGHPFLFLYLAVILSAILFDRGSSIVAVFLSAAAAAYLFLEPYASFRIARNQDVIACMIFIVVGLILGLLIELVHATVLKISLANQELAAEDKAKDLLLSEAAHRVRNDLQMLGALVELQQRDVQDPAGKAALSSTAKRIRLLGQVQQRLRRSDKAAVVDSQVFISELCNELASTMLGLRPITLIVHAEQHDLSQRRAVAVGLVINELLTNALKYAFPDDREGQVRVQFTREDDTFCLTVADNGIGINAKPGAANEGRTGLGKRLVRAMAAQLHGSYRIEPGEPGTVVTVEFPAALDEHGG